MKYAIQVLFDGGWLFVMDEDGKTVYTFDDREKAVKAADSWRKPEYPEAVRVVKY